jgi:hypothetical protein
VTGDTTDRETDADDAGTREGDRGRTRRALLSAAGAGAATATAGCLATLPPLGRRVRFGRVDVPATGDPGYREWLPAPSAFATPVAEDGYPVERAAPRRLLAGPGPSVAFPTRLLAPRLDYFGVGIENYDLLLSAGPVAVVEGEFDRGTVADAVSEGGYRRAGSLAGRDRYERVDGRATLAVGDGRLLYAPVGPDDDGGDRIGTVLRARRGEIPRYHETDEGFATLSATLGGRPWTWVHPTAFGTDPPAGVERTAEATTVTDDAVYVLRSFLYPAAGDVDEATLRSYLETSSRAPESRTTDLEVDGRVATAEIHLDHATYRRMTDDAGPFPQVTWTADRVDGGVRLRHEAGDPVPATALRVQYLLADGRVDADRQFGGGEVGPGDGLVVAPPADAERVLLWYEWGEESRAVVADYDLEGDG